MSGPLPWTTVFCMHLSYPPRVSVFWVHYSPIYFMSDALQPITPFLSLRNCWKSAPQDLKAHVQVGLRGDALNPHCFHLSGTFFPLPLCLPYAFLDSFQGFLTCVRIPGYSQVWGFPCGKSWFYQYVCWWEFKEEKGKNSTGVVLIDFLYKHISNYTSDHLLCLHEVNEYTKGIKFRAYLNLKSNCLDSCLDVS